jgi:hypothetical protein
MKTLIVSDPKTGNNAYCVKKSPVEKYVHGEAFPISMVVPEGSQEKRGAAPRPRYWYSQI